jgi:hypothetical protein
MPRVGFEPKLPMSDRANTVMKKHSSGENEKFGRPTDTGEALQKLPYIL